MVRPSYEWTDEALAIMWRAYLAGGLEYAHRVLRRHGITPTTNQMRIRLRVMRAATDIEGNRIWPGQRHESPPAKAYDDPTPEEIAAARERILAEREHGVGRYRTNQWDDNEHWTVPECRVMFE